MDFNEEIQAAFGEVGERAMPTVFILTNQTCRGVIRSAETDTELTEPGFSDKMVIVITAVRSQFSVNPENFVRETVNVPQGIFAGTYVVAKIQSDNAHHHFTCVDST